MNVSTNDYLNTALLQSLAQNKTASANAEPTVSGAVNGELVNIRKYDVLEKSRDYEDMRVAEEPEEKISEIERIRGMFSITDAIGKKLSQVSKTGKGFGEDDIAEICGAIGREIDNSFALGKLAEDEYNTLNEELDGYTKTLSERMVVLTSWHYVIEDTLKERAKIMRAQIEQAY